MSKKTFKPILFSTPMVQAILDDRKTMTRRIIKTKYSNTDIGWKEDKYGRRLVERQNDVPPPVIVNHGDGKTTTTRHLVSYREIPCKYKKGDVLWVRETYYAYGKWVKNGHPKTGKQKFTFFDYTLSYQCRFGYQDTQPDEIKKGRANDRGWYKRPSLFMPKEACRLFLKITDVRVERLQDITKEDAVKEGIKQLGGTILNYNYKDDRYTCGSAKESFQTLWHSINGAGSWEANPFVWVISFERTEKPNNFLNN